MKQQSLILGNYGLFLLASAILTSFQVSLWMQFFGYFPAPQIWITTLIYWTIYRRPSEGVIMTYLLTALIASLTAMPLSLLLITNIILFALTMAFKQRIYWSSPTYFMMLSALATLCFPVVHFILSFLFENNSITDPAVLDWILSSLLTALFALPTFLIYSWFDQLTHKELPTETGSGIYE